MPTTMKSPRAFPNPKRGKARSLIVNGPRKRLAAAGNGYDDVPYVRHGQATKKSRPERAPVSRTLEDLCAANDSKIRRILLAYKILQVKTGKRCPRCQIGTLGPLKKVKLRGLVHRCRKKGCQKFIKPEEGHLIFKQGSGPNSANALVCSERCHAKFDPQNDRG